MAANNKSNKYSWAVASFCICIISLVSTLFYHATPVSSDCQLYMGVVQQQRNDTQVFLMYTSILSGLFFLGCILYHDIIEKG